jgi:phosphatidylinositol glycan class U
MWRLWIVDRVANANFFFATTLAWMATQSALCVLCVKRVAEHTREAKAKLTAKKTK